MLLDMRYLKLLQWRLECRERGTSEDWIDLVEWQLRIDDAKRRDHQSPGA